jgi:pheromone a factor receptor
MGGDGLQYPEKTMASASTNPNPWPDLSATELDMATAQVEAGPSPQARNPYAILPTPFAKQPPKFPPISIPSLHSHKKTPSQQAAATTTLPTDASTPSLTTSSLTSRAGGTNHTGPGTGSGSGAQSTSNLQSPRQDPTTAAVFSPTATTSPSTAAPWSGTPQGAMIGVVDTRVWASPAPSPSTADSPPPTGVSRPHEGVTPSTSSGAGTERTGRGGGVRVETHIARRSMDLGQEGGADGDGNGEREKYEVRVDRSSNAAS